LNRRESKNISTIKNALAEYKKYGKDLSVSTFGGNIFFERRLLSNTETHVILAGPFEDERDARHHSRLYGQLNHCHIHRQLTDAGHGTIEIYDPEYDYFGEVPNGLQIVPKNRDTYFEIQHFEIAHQDELKSHRESLFYQGKLTIYIDEDNNLSGVNELPVEDYLKGVLHSEIEESPSPQFARTMAIVGRSQIFARLGQKHNQENFNFCSESHCMRYYGKPNDDSIIENALNETRGFVLEKSGGVCEAFFSYSCGGHTENAADVWLTDEIKFAAGKYDGRADHRKNYKLADEENARQWILSRPEVYCKQDPEDRVKTTKVASDSFRWEVFYTRNELEEILREKTGEELGLIYEIIPLKRGVSGRIKEIEILGSLKNVRIAGELNIRSALSKTLLNSSCFFIKQELDEDGIPVNFMFIGAGKGHGVGLCKSGAAKMAKNHTPAEEILKHYFKNTKLKKVY